MNPFSNKKKIRGWNNQVKKIDKWKKSYINLNIESFMECERDYVKILISPWYRLIKRNPPLWYNRLILDGLVEIYMCWHKALSGLKEPFNLKIWLYEPNFILSQIVYDRGSLFGYYNQTFEKCDVPREFPYDKYRIKNFNLQDFNWELFRDYDLRFKMLDELCEKDIEILEKKGYAGETYISGDTKDVLFKKQTNYVWVGTLKCD